jgi:hypothetical protein
VSRRPLSAVALAGLLVVAVLAAGGSAGVGAESASEEASRAKHGRAPWHPHVKGARRYARGRAGDVRFAITEFNGRLRGYNLGRSAPMASTYKAMLLVAYLRRIREQSIEPWERDLLRPMIRRSDNNAATTIDEILGRGPIEALARRAGMRHFRWNDAWGLSLNAAADQARFFRYLRRYVPRRHEGYAMRQLRSIVPSQRWGVAQVRPRGWRLYFKGGWGSGTGLVEHQTARLERGKRRIGLSVMSEGNPNHEYAKDTLRGVARRLLRGLSKVGDRP